MHQATSGSAGTRSATTPGVITLVLTACVFGLMALGARLPSLGFEPASLALAASSRNDAALTETAATDLGSTPVERRSVRVVRNSATPDAEPPAATSAQFTFAPVDVAATVADHTATVSWHAAKAPDSARLSHYRVTSPAGRSCVATSATHTCALHDLADDVVYRFTVAAVIIAGAIQIGLARTNKTHAGGRGLIDQKLTGMAEMFADHTVFSRHCHQYRT